MAMWIEPLFIKKSNIVSLDRSDKPAPLLGTQESFKLILWSQYWLSIVGYGAGAAMSNVLASSAIRLSYATMQS